MMYPSAWQHFKHIEKDGGFKNYCSNGKFQSIVEKCQVERINHGIIGFTK